ncbi:hypothetical protein [Rhizobium sp. CC-YZS058]|uniref:hypothetical protein n=1 Tax=Rhizobium sp. CC-YZS058 TaxID=3042153 RepID=UPI002B0548FD|nr:hypothetical protein [Rhizobium sp. CC-YZS058]MEA3536207.1 hypothetical protein [Rhizobium sp. CC-YZS058]
MSKQVIDYNGEPVGVVVPDAEWLKFVAVKYQVWDLDARRFRTAAEARAAVEAHLAAERIARPRPGLAA